MNKYFFDLVSRDRCEYDYSGRALDGPEQAIELANLIALDLEVGEDEKWSGWVVQVRNSQGQEIFSLPVQNPDLAAA
jgi:hypothetical protein